ncbi:unnamed protein product [Timema podura]|uniref:Uncharacterized protein n=1 Tax=Timema podura TaxID=61482 RepID=A0ABN7P8Q3_TIMPD|nr:unnamed protein product [Timema podura]
MATLRSMMVMLMVSQVVSLVPTREPKVDNIQQVFQALSSEERIPISRWTGVLFTVSLWYVLLTCAKMSRAAVFHQVSAGPSTEYKVYRQEYTGRSTTGFAVPEDVKKKLKEVDEHVPDKFASSLFLFVSNKFSLTPQDIRTLVSRGNVCTRSQRCINSSDVSINCCYF